jgi:putative molybdopterin biosynthesis protein
VPRTKKPELPNTERASPAAMMDTREVAAYLRLKERRVYDLVRKNTLPHIRATGKLLFPKAQIDAWLAAKAGVPLLAATTPPPIVAGSHDPLLEWAVRDSRCGLAILACGSSAGLDLLVRGEATVAAMHWLDPATGDYNVPLLRGRTDTADFVVIEWAKRIQGLLLAAGNPLRIKALADLVKKRARVVPRQLGAGSHHLFLHLLDRAKIDPDKLNWLSRPSLAETDLAAAIHDGHADAGVGIEAAARAQSLAFIPLATERLDLVMRRHDYFEPQVQALLKFLRTTEFSAHAKALGGYDITAAGRVVSNS